MTQITESRRLVGRRRTWPESVGENRFAADSSLPVEPDGWALDGMLGEGALARVYSARPASAPAGSPSLYALKMLRPHWQERPEAIALIRREAKVGRTVAHPHVAPVLAAHVHEPPYFVVMPRIEGETLADRLKHGALSVQSALWIARQAAQALEAMHGCGFLHGDVKPANLLIAPNGHLTLVDLGFARRPDESETVANRLVLGTVNYLAPELITSALRADERSDVFSLGIVLFEMLVGRPPLVARDLAELIRMHNEYRPPSLRSLRADLPPALAELVHQMLCKEPLRRPDSMSDVVQALVRLEIETLAQRAA